MENQPGINGNTNRVTPEGETSQAGAYEKHNAGRLTKGALHTGKIKEVAVIIAAWLAALALVYMVIVKMSVLFH